MAADGVLAVVPFNGEPGLVARIRQQDLTADVLVPLDSNQPVGIRYFRPPTASVDIEYLGGTIGAGISAPAGWMMYQCTRRSRSTTISLYEDQEVNLSATRCMRIATILERKRSRRLPTRYRHDLWER